MRIAIAGAGLAGLTLANIAQRAGLDVTVYEKADGLDARNPGYRIHLNSTGTAALHAALPPRLWDLFLATSGVPRQTMLTFNSTLTEMTTRDVSLSRGHGAAVEGLPEHLIASRMTLRRILEAGLAPGTIRFGRAVTGFRVDSTVEIALSDGERREVDILVGADGVNSTVAQQRLPDLEVIDLGARHVAAKVPLDETTRAQIPAELFSTFSMCHGEAHDALTFAPIERADPHSDLVAEQSPEFRAEATEDFALCMFSLLSDDRLPDSELFTAAPADLQELILGRMTGWAEGLRRLVELWDVETVRPLSIRGVVPIPAWEPNAVTLIGDAVHAMSPALGIGANTALHDAVVLGTELAAAARNGSAVQAAVGRYEEAMREYGFAAARNSAAMGERVIGHRPLPDREDPVSSP